MRPGKEADFFKDSELRQVPNLILKISFLMDGNHGVPNAPQLNREVRTLSDRTTANQF
jgi:hypothetical protein